MTTRKFNYTGRQRLTRETVGVILEHGGDGRPTFSVSATLEGYAFPQDALVVAEAYKQSRFERFELGAVGEVAFPVQRELGLFAEGEAVSFRLKVIGTGGLRGRLLGEVDKLVPMERGLAAGSRVTLLRTEAIDLGDKVWEVNLDDEPILRLNNRMGAWRALVTSAQFAYIAYPAILEKILSHVVIELGASPNSDLAAWEQLWLRFAMAQPGVPDFPASPGEDDCHLRDWVDAAVDCFCRKNRLLKRAAMFCDGGQE